MRKLIVVLMAALMLLSFTSCNQDKIDELEKKVKEQEAEKESFGEFVQAFTSVMAVEQAYSEYVVLKGKGSGSPITLYYKDGSDYIVPEFSGNDLSIWITQQAILKNPDIIDIQYQKDKASGTVTYEGTPSQNNLNYKIVNNTIELKYKLKGSEEYEKETMKLGIDGSVSRKVEPSSDEKSVTASLAFDGTICEKTINLSFVATMSEANGTFIKFTAATINGKNVNLDLLNNLADGMVPMNSLYMFFGM